MALYYLLLSYLVGSIPFAYVFTKLSSGSDIRRIASQNVGTTNVMLNVGWLPGLLTMIGDVGKGVAVGLLADLCPIRWVRALMPAVAIVGHNWPIWLKFKGGGGLATFIGGSLATRNFSGTIIAVLIWGLSFLLIKDHDRSALVACIAAPLAFLLLGVSSPSLVFYGTSSVAIGARRIQSILEKRFSHRRQRQVPV